jgi:hypothetical protein
LLGNRPPQVIVGRYADVHAVFSEPSVCVASDFPDGVQEHSNANKNAPRERSRFRPPLRGGGKDRVAADRARRITLR